MSTERLQVLAERFASGSAIDWDTELVASNESERSVVESMHILALISAAHTGVRGNQLDPKVAELTGSHMETAPPGSASVVPFPMSAREHDQEELVQWDRLLELEFIGKGSSARVYKAWDSKLGRWVALKLGEGLGGARNEDLLREARILAKLRNENIVRIYDAVEHEGRLGIWMELIEGRRLDRIVEFEGEMDETRAAAIVAKVARALVAVHRAGVIHKDITARNVMVAAGGRVVLMDFGAGIKIDDFKEETAPNDLGGTPYYWAPEVLTGDRTSHRTDIYSLGVLLFHLVTKRFPIEAKSLNELGRKLRERQFMSLVDVRPDLSADFCAIVDRALDPDPAQRFPKAGKMALALERLASPAREGEQDRRREVRRRQIRISIVISSVVLAFVSWFIYVRATSYSVEMSFLRATAAGRQPLPSGSRVAPSDLISMQFEATRRLYVYVLNQDDLGNAVMLFPIHGLDRVNPLPAKERIDLPGAIKGHLIHWQVTSAGGREHYIVIVAREPQRDLETLLASIPTARFGAPVALPPGKLQRIGALRSTQGLAFGPQAPVSPADSLLLRIKELTTERERQRGILVRRFVVTNPVE